MPPTDRPNGKRDRERGARSQRALDADGPAMRADDALRDRKPEPSALRRRRRLVVRLKEFLEDERHVLRRNDSAGIAHEHLPGIVHRRDGELHRATALGELECVREQVAQHLAHAGLVPYDLIGQSGSTLHMEADSSLNRKHAKRRLELREKWNQLHGSELELSAAGLEAAPLKIRE